MSNLQKKLFEFEASPPAGAWDKITTALNEDASNLSKRLYNFEAPPPAAVWAAVETAMERAIPPAKRVPLFVQYRTPLRYIAAASVVAVLLFSATLWLRQPDDSLVTRTDGSLPAASGAPANPGITTDDTDAAEPTVVAINSAALTPVTATVIKRSFAAIRPQNILSSLSFSRRFIPRRASEDASLNLSGPDNFMVYCDNEGNAMKLPKKLFSLVNCEEGDETCKERIQQLRQKLAANTAPGDFVGMLDLVRQLQ